MVWGCRFESLRSIKPDTAKILLINSIKVKNGHMDILSDKAAALLSYFCIPYV